MKNVRPSNLSMSIANSVIKSDTGYEEYFNKHQGRVKVPVLSRTKYSSVITAMIKRIRYHWLESGGGVYVKGLGYFGIMRLPDKSISFMHNRFGYFERMETDGYVYFPIHRTDLVSSDNLSDYSFNEGFSHRFNEEMHAKLKAGKQYTLHAETIKKILKAKQR